MNSPFSKLTSLLTGFLMASWSIVSAETEQSQTFTLQPGWNAIWLDPSPVDANGNAQTPENVFTNASISKVARPVLAAGSAEFIASPTDVFNQDTWLVWYRDPQSLINTLGSIEGSQAYYIEVEGDSAINVTVTGEVELFRPEWVAGSYNLIGFNLSQTISFEDFFGTEGESTGTHPISSILRIEPTTGAWTGVNDTDLMQPGEAYWIQSTKNSDFMGPVAVSFDGTSSLDFATGTGDAAIESSGQVLNSAEITFSNVDTSAHSPVITLVSPTTATELILYEIVTGSDGLSYEIGSNGAITTWDIGSIAAQASQTVTVGAERNWSTGALSRENLYRIDIGAQYFWLPASASYPNITVDPGDSLNPTSAGLWVGEITLDSVSLIGQSTPEDTTSTAPMRIIIHVDDSGSASLLSQVMIMETKTADDSVDAETVLIVNHEQIPYYQGVVTRGGKKVGLRVEAAAFDMPRNYGPTSQAAILDQVAAADDDIASADDVTADNIESFLNLQTARPSTLEEVYLTSWPLSGSVESGGAITTTNPLTLDPFHRSNPFRHAFHPQHAAGYAISRDISIAFETTTSSTLLTGYYTEEISGLTKSTLTTRGPITLTRVTSVSELK